MDRISPRRLRSASVQLGALTALALTLSGCNMVSDDDCDDDRSMGAGGAGGTVVAMAVSGPAVSTRTGTDQGERHVPAMLPDRGGFGTHLASCGG
ncbi:hypothetical protein O7632_29390 [Solwaraspora sp. WMMD406]|uniref:hypothetical protein n=1 Tax=Solwaraspora sp. WMMD406 TaxID=3016095 RepID=UPI002416CF2D|nr:hypothetical protein [Solwaraspora sp. WMMD406]MDG4768171.1 hypothetical protein [Solwaraspora sp. WMMD406]